MPKVDIYCRRHVSLAEITRLIEAMPTAVAKALSVVGDPDTQLTSNDVEVYHHEVREYDVQHCDVAIYIEANHYDSREIGLKIATGELSEKAQVILLQGRKAFVWIRLVKAGFAEFQGGRFP